MITHLHHIDFLDPATSDALRSLDPANVDLQVAACPRAQETLARILATDPSEPITTPLIRTRLGRRARRRWVVAGAALVGVGAMVVAAPGLRQGDPAATTVPQTHRMLADNTELASWSPTTKAVTPAEAAKADKECRRQWAGIGPKVVEAAHTALFDHRGAWTFVLLEGSGGFEATCLSNGSSKGFGGGGSAGRHDTAAVASNTAVVHPGEVSFTADVSYWQQTGRVGSNVASVVINTIQQGPVTATIQGGYFAAWWPGPGQAMGKDSEKGMPPEPTYTLILKDGTIKAAIPQAQLTPHPK
jgi:hypothetical protein